MVETPLRVADALRLAAAGLQDFSDTPRLDAELLMASALGASRSELLLRHMSEAVPPNFSELLVRRKTHEPVAYILGEQEFFGLTLRVTSAVLIPRGDSEVLVDAAIAARPDARRVLDCGTGSGALLLAVLAHLPAASGVGIDNSTAALAIAAQNAASLGLTDRATMTAADWRHSGWTTHLGGPFDLILANPPYVEANAVLAAGVRDHEPAAALFAGTDGLEDYLVLIPQLPGLLEQGGAALFEIGHTQAEAVSALAAAAGLTATLHRDLAGRPRVLQFRRTAQLS
jgi:release factor glutamine methyltransferase